MNKAVLLVRPVLTAVFGPLTKGPAPRLAWLALTQALASPAPTPVSRRAEAVPIARQPIISATGAALQEQTSTSVL